MKTVLIMVLGLLFTRDVKTPFEFKWEKYKMDGHRTGVTFPTGSNNPEALGVIKGKCYYSPSRHAYRKGSTYKVASLMIDAQASVASVKECIGYAPREMVRSTPQCELSNWFTDFLISETSRLTGKNVDFSIANFGGIRIDMPQGNITVDDITSMFPFKNTLCYIALRGSDVRKIFEQFASTRLQPFGGAQVVIRDKRLESIMIGGEPLDDRKVYGLATISFLLNGGDGLNLARNAQDLIITETYIKDAMIPYVKSLTAEGKKIEYHLDQRITVIEEN